MATLRSHQGKGLSKTITSDLLEEISPMVDLIYAEARACCFSINKVFYDLGFNFAGSLQKQCVLSGQHDVSEEGPYENLNVWYLNSSRKHLNEAH